MGRNFPERGGEILVLALRYSLYLEIGMLFWYCKGGGEGGGHENTDEECIVRQMSFDSYSSPLLTLSLLKLR